MKISRTFGYEFAPAFWGYGYAIEANQKIIEYVFEELERESILAYTRPANIRSQHLLEKLGFWKTGRRLLDEGRTLCALHKLSVWEVAEIARTFASLKAFPYVCKL